MKQKFERFLFTCDSCGTTTKVERLEDDTSQFMLPGSWISTTAQNHNNQPFTAHLCGPCGLKILSQQLTNIAGQEKEDKHIEDKKDKDDV